MRHRQRQPILNDKYQLLGKQLGEGGLGKVFLAQNIETGQRVAVKHTLKNLQQSQLIKELSKNQVETLLKLKGVPYILQIRDHFQRDNKQFIVTELCQGGTLSALIKKRIFTNDFAIFVISSILKGYLAIKKEEILHRDLKPSNILFTQKGELRIADFGFATTLVKLQKEGTLSIGSSLYMPPQSLTHYHYSEKSDIWAIGVIFYQIVFGKYPWYDKTKLKILEKVLLNPISTILPQGVDQWITIFLTKALDFDPSKRATTQELLALLPVQNFKTNSIEKTEIQQSKTLKENKTEPLKTQNIEDLRLTEDSMRETKESEDTIVPSKPIYRKKKHAESGRPEEITKILLHQVDYCRLQYEVLRMVTTLKYKDEKFHKFVLKNDLQAFLWSHIEKTFQKMTKIDYNCFSLGHLREYKKCDEYSKICQIIVDYRKKFQDRHEYPRLHNSKIQKQKNRFNQVLIWFYENVVPESPYQLFVLYDYLITIKWLLEIQENEGIKELCEIDMGDLVKALRREGKAMNKTIRQQYLCQLGQKLEQLDIITRA